MIFCELVWQVRHAISIPVPANGVTGLFILQVEILSDSDTSNLEWVLLSKHLFLIVVPSFLSSSQLGIIVVVREVPNFEEGM